MNEIADAPVNKKRIGGQEDVRKLRGEMRELPEEIKSRLKSWKFWLHFWRVIEYVLFWGGITLSTIVTANLSIVAADRMVIEILSLSASLCLWFSVGIKPAKRSANYHIAWRILRNAADRYLYDDTMPIKDLFDAREAGWKHIPPGNAP